MERSDILPLINDVPTQSYNLVKKDKSNPPIVYRLFYFDNTYVSPDSNDGIQLEKKGKFYVPKHDNNVGKITPIHEDIYKNLMIKNQFTKNVSDTSQLKRLGLDKKGNPFTKDALDRQIDAINKLKTTLPNAGNLMAQLTKTMEYNRENTNKLITELTDTISSMESYFDRTNNQSD